MDEIIHAISEDGFVSLTVINSKKMAEQARQYHDSSPVATAALGRVLSAVSMMGSGLKIEGSSITVRIDGGGPMGTIIAVSDNMGNTRCCAANTQIDMPLRETDGKLDVGAAVGSEGMLTVIRDMGSGEPYTGSVALVSGEIAEDFSAYFHASEQVATACALGVLVDRDWSVKASGGYIVSLLPGASEEHIDIIEANILKTGPVTSILENGTAQDIINGVLEGLNPRILSRSPVEYRCYCSRDRVVTALSSLGHDDIDDILSKGETVEITCQFCDCEYNFTPEEIKSFKS